MPVAAVIYRKPQRKGLIMPIAAGKTGGFMPVPGGPVRAECPFKLGRQIKIGQVARMPYGGHSGG